MPRKTFVANEILTASDVNEFLMDQSVMVFAGSAARGSAIPSPSEGMVTYLEDADELQVFDGSAFTAVGVQPAILQVVSTTKTDTFTTSSTSFEDITGLSVSITPQSASNKILVSYSLQGSGDVGTANGGFQLVRNSTAIAIGDAAGSRSRLSSYLLAPASNDQVLGSSVVHLDSPSSTSTLTYKVQGRMLAAGTLFINRADNDADAAIRPRVVSSITVMEVAG